MPGLDLRQVENVVDQREQVVAGGLDGLGILHLLLGQVPLRVVREELGQDERRIERRAQLVRHVGQEVGLVPARLLQLAGLELQGGLRPERVVALRLEDLGLLLELGVGLLELGLLLLEPGLRLLQCPALLFEFLVGDAQLFALGLQFLGLPLGLLQEVLQVGAVVRRLARPRRRTRTPSREARIVSLVERADEAQLEHPVHRLLVRNRER